MVKKLFFTLFVMSAFCSAHAQNTLLERTQVPESSFFSFKMPGLPSSWLSCVPGYMSVLKGTVSDWYERFYQTASQIKIADHKELIVGACAAGVVSYLAYCAVGKYRHSYWQKEYNKLLQEYEKKQEELYLLMDLRRDVYYQIRDCINKNRSLCDRKINVLVSVEERIQRKPYTFTMDDFMSAVTPPAQSFSGVTYDDSEPLAYVAIRELMNVSERKEAQRLVGEFKQLSSQFLAVDRTLRDNYYVALRNCEIKLGIAPAQNPFIKRGLKYQEPLEQEKKSIEAQLDKQCLDYEIRIRLNKRLRDVAEEIMHLC